MITFPYGFNTFLGKQVHIGITGSIAAYKIIDLVRFLSGLNISISATLTDSASRFVTGLALEAAGAETVFSSLFKGPDSVYSHLYPQTGLDAFLVAPATANIIAKAANGIADDMLSTQILANTKPLLFAPAMNPNLYNAKPTRRNIQTLVSDGHTFIGPDSGNVACGDTGKGRMSSLQEISFHVLKAVTEQDLAGRRVLVTLGPTREYFDPVRFWSNPSSGLMGACIAVAAWMRGADVHVVHGPCDVLLPGAMHTHPVTTALEMHDKCHELWPSMDVGGFSAAVADFRPPRHGEDKFKKQGSGALVLEFEKNPDILASIGAKKRSGQRLVGFAAETSDIEQNAKSKLERKNLDILLANPVNVAGSGFCSSTNKVFYFDCDGRYESWPLLDKSEIGWRIWDNILQL